MTSFLEKTMKRTLTIATCIALLSFQAPLSYAMDMTDLNINKVGDIEMSCNQISREISSMEKTMFSTQEMQKNSHMANTGVGVVKTVGSYLVGSLGGALGILAAGYLVSEATGSKAEDASVLHDAATQRRSFMAGIYNAKECIGPLTMASIEPAAGKKMLAPKKHPSRKPRYND